MNVWVVCMTEMEADIYNSQDLGKGVSCVTHLQESGSELGFKRLAGTIADEMDYACGEGTWGRLILSGSPDVLSRLCQHLSDEVRQRIIGIIPANLCGGRPDEICSRCKPFLKLAA